MEGIDKFQILNDEVKILKNEIKDILVEIKEMLITLPQNLAASYSLDESGGPKNERPSPEYHQDYREPLHNDDTRPLQTSAASMPQAQMQQQQMPQMQMPQAEPNRYQPTTFNISTTVERREETEPEQHKRKSSDRKAESPEKQWTDEEEMELKETRNINRDGERAKSNLREESEEREKVSSRENKKEMLKKEIEKEEKTDESDVSASPAGDVDILTLATFSRWLNSGMNRLGKERMQEIIEVSASMGGISSTMRDILLRLLQMDNGQGYIVKESLSVLIDLDNILTRNKKSREESAVLSLFINDRDEIRG